MGSATVRLLLHGELVSEVPLLDAPLRIGRMKENDLVVNNLSVSRFHATLARDGDGFVLTDLGSENGCWVNGRRVKESRVGPGDRILVGKHQLEIAVEDAAGETAAGPRGKSDAWDAAATYLVGAETQARMAAGGVGPAGAAPPSLDEAQAAPEPPDAEAAASLPSADEGVELFGNLPASGDLGGPDLAEFDVSELDLRPAELPTAVREEPLASLAGDAPAEDGTELLDLGAAPRVEAQPGGAPAAVHAGLIVQRSGRLERTVAWEAERLTMGRATECDVLLATPEVSRRHAMLVREDDRYEVRDLESINGTFVNGEKVSRRVLQVGDVIRIEDFEITFVLDRARVDGALKSEPRAAAPATGRDPGMTQIGEMTDLAPFVAEDEAEPSEAMSFDSLPPLEALPEAEALPEIDAPAEAEFAAPGEPDTVLLADEEPDEELDPEKDLVEAPREARVVRLELRVRVEELPPALREALSGLDPADLKLPVELRLDTEEGSG
jgi:pSer/pThr/pTyr-binding forkhead associated (FHA) protein